MLRGHSHELQLKDKLTQIRKKSFPTRVFQLIVFFWIANDQMIGWWNNRTIFIDYQYLSEAATSVNADVGIATNSLKDKLTVSTIVAWKISRGSERNLQENKINQGIIDQVQVLYLAR